MRGRGLAVVTAGCIAGGCLLRPTADPKRDAAAPAPDAANPANVMFVTSQPVLISGLTAADNTCNALATQAGRPGTYVAWVSTNMVNARDRLGSASGWVRTDGMPFADTVDDLVAGTIYYPPRLDERGSDVGAGVLVATGTQADGTDYSGTDCGDLTGGAGFPIGVGVTGAGKPEWTFANQTADCGSALSLYCFETDRVATVAPPAAASPRVFVSHDLFSPDGGSGRPAADEVCISEALALGLTGSFVSVLDTNEATATARLGTPTQPWLRFDGVPTTMDFVSFTAPISVDSSGAYVGEPVFTGGSNGAAMANLDCSDWEDAQNTAQAIMGQSSRSDTAFDAQALTCNHPAPVYCAEVQ
jgi:hypothetical protein